MCYKNVVKICVNFFFRRFIYFLTQVTRDITNARMNMQWVRFEEKFFIRGT